jgi:hypothetical protein
MSNAEVAARIEAHLREQGLIPEPPPNWSYFQKRRGPMFCWTTEPDEHDPCAHCGGHELDGLDTHEMACSACGGSGQGKGWYFSFVYKPVGPGARSGKAESWEFIESSLRKHRKRKDAKARAEKLYDKS